MGQPESDARIGQMIGNYLVCSVLGKGGMGSVYVGEHPEIRRRVAIKVLHPSLTDFTERFIDEARIIAQLEHPNIIDIYDFGRTDDGSLYYVMEILKGVDLGEVIDENMQMSPVEVMPYLVQICSALDATHKVGVVHRDLKLENIYVLDRDPLLVKLLDFGISKRMDTHTHARGHSKTGTGVVMGTPTFMAPEQAAGRQEQIGPETDLYAVGVILFYMLTGRPPFAAETGAELLVKHMKEPPPSIRSIDPDLPKALDSLLDICLAKDPKQRPPTAGWIAEAYAKALALEQVVPSPPQSRATAGGRRPTTEPKARSPVSPSTLSGSAAEMSAITLPRSSGWRRVAFAIAALAVGVAVVFALRWTGDPEPTAARQQGTTSEARSGQRASPDLAVKINMQTVIVVSNEPDVECRYTVANGDPRTASAPCRIEVPFGEELSLEVRRQTHSPWAERWRVKGNRTIRAMTLLDEKRVTIVDLSDAAPGSPDGSTPPAVASPAPPPEASTRNTRKRRRRAARRRGRKTRSKRRTAKSTAPKKTTEPTAKRTAAPKKATKKKESKRVGAGTLDF